MVVSTSCKYVQPQRQAAVYKCHLISLVSFRLAPTCSTASAGMARREISGLADSVEATLVKSMHGMNMLKATCMARDVKSLTLSGVI